MAFVEGEDGLAVGAEEHEVGLPVAGGLAVRGEGGAVDEGAAVGDTGGGAAALAPPPAPFELGPGQIVAPGIVLRAADRGAGGAASGHGTAVFNGEMCIASFHGNTLRRCCTSFVNLGNPALIRRCPKRACRASVSRRRVAMPHRCNKVPHRPQACGPGICWRLPANRRASRRRRTDQFAGRVAADGVSPVARARIELATHGFSVHCSTD